MFVKGWIKTCKMIGSIFLPLHWSGLLLLQISQCRGFSDHVHRALNWTTGNRFCHVILWMGKKSTLLWSVWTHLLWRLAERLKSEQPGCHARSVCAKANAKQHNLTASLWRFALSRFDPCTVCYNTPEQSSLSYLSSYQQLIARKWQV